MNDLLAFKQRFDALWLPTIEELVRDIQRHAQDELLAHAAQHVVMLAAAGGKRVRPYVAALAYELSGKAVSEEVLLACSAFETFHLFALIHDDIIDHGEQRHGVACLHTYIEQLLRRDHRHGDVAHIARGQAMLLGNILYGLAQQTMRRAISQLPLPSMQAVLDEFDAMAREVMVGEMLDVDSVTCADVSDHLVETKMFLKTASYTFVRPMRAAACMWDAPQELLVQIDALGEALGVAFQIQDDVLDITQPSSQTGKLPFTDLREHQHTVFTQHVNLHGGERDRRVLAEFMGASLEESDRARIEALFARTGAFDALSERVERLFDTSERVIERMAGDVEAKTRLQALVAAMRHRMK